MDKNKTTFKMPAMFTQSERESIIKEYLSGGFTKNGIWKKHTGQDLEKSQLLRWMRQLGYISKEKRQIHIKLASKHKFKTVDSSEESYNSNELQNRIKELEKALAEEKIKAEGYQLMIDIAEKELKLPIRKKSNTK